MHMHIGARNGTTFPALKKGGEILPHIYMGLLNWLHDRRVVDLQNTVKLMASDLKVLQGHQDLLETKFNSVNAKLSRRSAPKEEESDEGSELEELIKSFGGELPIELRQKYKKP